MEPIGQLTVRNFTSPQQWDRRALVLDDDLFSANTLVTALSACGLTARFALPVTPAHLRDAVRWGPELALLDVDVVDDEQTAELVDILRAADVGVVALTTRPGETTARRLRDTGTVVVDKTALAADPEGALRDLLGASEPAPAPAFATAPTWAAAVA
jgi:CheY-like chemotaxis protein